MLLDGSVFVKSLCSMFRSSQICLVMRKATKRISRNASQGWRIQFHPQNGCVWHSSITGTISDWKWFSSLILKHNSNPYRMKYYTTLLIKAPIINTLYKERSPYPSLHSLSHGISLLWVIQMIWVPQHPVLNPGKNTPRFLTQHPLLREYDPFKRTQ